MRRTACITASHHTLLEKQDSEVCSPLYEVQALEKKSSRFSRHLLTAVQAPPTVRHCMEEAVSCDVAQYDGESSAHGPYLNNKLFMLHPWGPGCCKICQCLLNTQTTDQYKVRTDHKACPIETCTYVDTSQDDLQTYD